MFGNTQPNTSAPPPSCRHALHTKHSAGAMGGGWRGRSRTSSRTSCRPLQRHKQHPPPPSAPPLTHSMYVLDLTTLSRPVSETRTIQIHLKCVYVCEARKNKRTKEQRYIRTYRRDLRAGGKSSLPGIPGSPQTNLHRHAILPSISFAPTFGAQQWCVVLSHATQPANLNLLFLTPRQVR